MNRVIVTGATGFVGANLVRRLLRDGHEVHLLVRDSHRSWRIDGIRGDVRLHQVSLGDPEGLDLVVGQIRPEWVFHLAVNGAYSWQADVREIVGTNINGTVNLLEASLKSGCQVFVNTGSSSEYGFKDHAPSEDEVLQPNSYYAVTKASATMFCQYSAQRTETHIPTLRLYSVYGAYEEPGRLMPELIRHGLSGGLPPLANPGIARDYVYIDDVVDAFILAAGTLDQERGAVYNVGTGVQTTLGEVVDVARRIMGIQAEPEWGSMPERSWDTTMWVADIRKIRRALGWEPGHTFEQGFADMAAWFRENPALWHRHPAESS